MDIVLTIILDGLIYASWLFIVALGLTLVFGVLRILNFAHGGLYALGAYAAAVAVPLFAGWGLPEWFSLVAMFIAALAVAIVVAPLIERGLLRFFYGRDEVLVLLVTYAVFLMLEDITKMVFGVDPYYVFEPRNLFGNVEVGSLFYVGYDIALIGLAIVCGVGVWLGLTRTRIGKITVAVINEPEVSAAMGVNVTRIYLLAFGLGVFLAALGGAFTSPLISVQPGISVSVIIVSFAVVIIGGLGSIPGAAIGALIVGLARSFAVYEIPEAEIFIIYLVMVVVLIFRPEGLFTPVQARKI
ncbi:branched-chain amino acid ABC transporter permease [Aurantimonas sp. C2-6-R+9]|uniref:branched-chain amino acid ABC transporter permease n=1 Tax=unclassified Aurantimonas TaxID=2638230 RepID=UPI002E184A85|nr:MULTISPECIES: branched-chain amino acid ABC transporter permease [unclassified Aurantimonas]MEC5289455.1 branched-chain amino acid ABC transporter permease [Aurantimonas sp. C2-3-R2]MEC5322962.1 branched-chain amino acid ABC transporter permease [Aurantimonas sp. A3-2-R12]MEC5380812.1 branched-chain amino acid ABC transporter permease [Aurantimonas sp. C2-6-R+9]MEC5410535.1 branched-chain amino acid ABC transporter permease [Aurantimonas sp. C2-4-R8]